MSEELESRWRRRWEVFCQGVIAFATVAAVVVASRALQQSHEAALQSNAIAQQAQQTFIAAERPLISFDDLQFRSAEEGFEYQVSLKNFGMGPAIRVRVETQASSQPPPASRTLETEPGDGTLGQGVRYRTEWREWPAAAREGRRSVYLYGIVTYDDLFGRTHHTGFCKTAPPGETFETGPSGELLEEVYEEECGLHTWGD